MRPRLTRTAPRKAPERPRTACCERLQPSMPTACRSGCWPTTPAPSRCSESRKRPPLSTKWPNSCSDKPEAAIATAADLAPEGLREQLAHLHDRIETLPQPHGAALAGARLALGGAGQDPL